MVPPLAEWGIKTSEHGVLNNLRRDPGPCQQALDDRCFTAKSHIRALLADLGRRQLIVREPQPTDERAKRLALTTDGARLASKRAEALTEEIVMMTAEFVPGELQGLRAQTVQFSGRPQGALTQARSAG